VLKIAYMTCVVAVTVFQAAMTMMELELEWPKFRPAGDSSLSFNSINWLAGITVSAATYICFFLV
jgi:hypothetical protein